MDTLPILPSPLTQYSSKQPIPDEQTIGKVDGKECVYHTHTKDEGLCYKQKHLSQEPAHSYRIIGLLKHL